MKKFLSLSLLLSLGLSGITPALNAAQPALAQKNPSGWAAAKKWWRAGRNVNALTPQEQQAFNSLKKRMTTGAITTALAALLGAATYITYKEGKYLTPKARAAGIVDNLLIMKELSPESEEYKKVNKQLAQQIVRFKETVLTKRGEGKTRAVKMYVQDMINEKVVGKQNALYLLSDFINHMTLIGENV